MNEITNRVSPDGGFDPRLLTGKQAATTPCDHCAVPIDSDIHAEELGMCLDCSNKYWGHEGENE
jgi:hypothetical protein